MATKPKAERYKTPRGVLIKPRVRGKASTQFNKGGEWYTKLALEGEAAEKMQETLQPLLDDALDQMKRENKKYAKVMKMVNPGKPELDEESGEETGRTIFNFKQQHRVKSKKSGEVFEFNVAVFDAKGKPLPEKAKLGTGSEGKVVFEARPYFIEKDKEAGISLKLKAVQVLKFVEYVPGGDASSYGFKEEEGFDASEYEGDEEDNESSDDNSDDEPDEDAAAGSDDAEDDDDF